MPLNNWILYPVLYITMVAVTFYIITFIYSKKEDKEKKFFSDEELPFVSVIIPAYNEEGSVKGTLDSILDSDYPGGFEVIFVNDGSSDNTFSKANNYNDPRLRVFDKENGGKASALNFGISKAKGDFVISMDADTFVDKDSMKKMMRYFKDESVMSVTPAMTIYKPQSIWQRVQHIEYLMGIFLRKVFASLNSIYIAPGAFSAYRKSFFDKYGGYEEGNIVEDLELAMRIQYHGFRTENSPTARIRTIGPRTFKPLLKQRLRWYYGLIQNFWRYRKMISKDYGDMGMVVMPIGWTIIFFSMFILVYWVIRIINTVQAEMALFAHLGYEFSNFFEFSKESFYIAFLNIVSDPLTWFALLSLAILIFYLVYSHRKVGKIYKPFTSVFAFVFLFMPLFAFWWIVSFFYLGFSKVPKWR
ncbi:MAG: glycosyltransferase family 2 protein [Candidatus Pacearchaeota archaeon]